ncbi:MAG: alcohol dehydrogenase catalytic domain-containing protein [Solirubrobacteraceae bacterium]|jgi:2-desacetyl-2-hydroxyethyl bacteriochlorophyllide A dehydrogenase
MSAATARAARYTGERKLEVVDVQPRLPGDGEVTIDVAFTGICGTDLHIFHGAMDARVTMPAVLGHEMSGTIAAVGQNVDGWSVGDRVTVMPLGPCGSCPACRSGNSHICHNLNFIGIDSPGSMQSSWTVPESVLVAIPPALALDHAALAEPTAVAVHDVRRANLQAGERALIVGGGPIGLLVACVARSKGADVVVCEVSPQRLELARSLGLKAIDPVAVSYQDFVADWTDGAGADATFEVSGSPDGVETALQSLSVRGRMVLVAIHATPPPVNLQRVFWRELTIIGARVYERVDFEEAVSLLAAGVIPAEALISLIEPLDDASAAFAELEAGKAMKVLIDCNLKGPDA